MPGDQCAVFYFPPSKNRARHCRRRPGMGDILVAAGLVAMGGRTARTAIPACSSGQIAYNPGHCRSGRKYGQQPPELVRALERKSVGSGKRESVRVELGGRRITKNKKKGKQYKELYN